jgi:integrase
MSKSRKKKPAYLLHKPSGRARVRINGEDIYLGEYGTPASREKYDDLIADWFARNGDVKSYVLEIDDLYLLYHEHSLQHYRKNGRLTSEYHCVKSAVRPLIKLYGRTRVRDFGPRALKNVRQAMVDAGHVRGSVNSMINRIRRMFRWGVENEHVPVAVYQSLCAVQGLQSGRTTACESEPVLPVKEAIVNATLKHVSPVVAAMIQLQLLTGARPGELVNLRPCDLTMGTDGMWTYRPEGHKTEHRGRERRIYVGPEAQAILRPYLNRAPEEFCFSPRETMDLRHTQQREERKSPMTPSQAARCPKTKPKRSPSNRYTTASYRRAIERACEAAFGMPAALKGIPRDETGNRRAESPAEKKKRLKLATEWRRENVWNPHQLRHTRATVIRKQYGLEAAQVVLGHADCKVTEVYAERDFELAARVMKEIG